MKSGVPTVLPLATVDPCVPKPSARGRSISSVELEDSAPDPITDGVAVASEWAGGHGNSGSEVFHDSGLSSVCRVWAANHRASPFNAGIPIIPIFPRPPTVNSPVLLTVLLAKPFSGRPFVGRGRSARLCRLCGPESHSSRDGRNTGNERPHVGTETDGRSGQSVERRKS